MEKWRKRKEKEQSKIGVVLVGGFRYMETCGKRCEKKTALHASMQQKKRKKKIRKKGGLKRKVISQQRFY